MEDVALLELGRTVVLVALVILSGGLDLRTNRIPNAITVPAFGLGLALAGLVGFGSLLAHLAAAAITLLVGTALFATRVLGGGDVKMMVAVAAIIGPAPLPLAFLLACIAGGILAVVDSLRRGTLLRVLRSSKDMVLHWASLGRFGRPPVKSGGVGAIPYGVAIGIGALLAWFL